MGVTWQHGGVVLGLGEAVGLPLSFAGPWVTGWGCGGASVGLGVLKGVGTYLPTFYVVTWPLQPSWQRWDRWGSGRGLVPSPPVMMLRSWGRACSAAHLCLVSLWLPGDVSLALVRPCPYSPHVSG